MSKLEIGIENNILKICKITTRKSEKNLEKYDINLLQIGKQYKSDIKVTKGKEKNKVLFFEKIDSKILDEELEDDKTEDNKIKQQPVIVVYSNEEKIRFMYCTMEYAYKILLKLKYKILRVSLNRRRIKITLLAYLVNKYGIKYDTPKFYIDNELYVPCKLKEYKKVISKLKMLKDKNIYTYKFKIKDLLKDKSTINGPIRFALNIDGNEFDYKVAKKATGIDNIQHYYAPYKSTWTKDYAIHIRRTIYGNLVLVNRQKEPIERTLKFKIMESKIVSKFLYYISKKRIAKRKEKINVFYEKFASKAEEGTYELFLLMQKNKTSKNYFVISEDSPDYQRIKDNKGVVKKYSLKYYWIIYNANKFISTEAPIHLNILRSNNASLRKSLTDKPFIFLQHGITYLKCQGANSTFAKNKEGQVSYIVVGSEKEKEVVVESLNINEEQVLKTGLPIFDKVKYNHINKDSEDYITVMLTWKPYEEQLYNFEESSYYKNVIEICDLLKKYTDNKKIIIISHPKAQSLLVNTDLKNSIWDKPISEALEKTKLLITDYSSVCYNTFYQGGGVIFYQPDLELYEAQNGKLIPYDDEYIGKRAFNIHELETIISQTIKNKRIDLKEIRTEKFEQNYKTINEFHDGKNIERIYNEITKLEMQETKKSHSKEEIDEK